MTTGNHPEYYFRCTTSIDTQTGSPIFIDAAWERESTMRDTEKVEKGEGDSELRKLELKLTSQIKALAEENKRLTKRIVEMPAQIWAEAWEVFESLPEGWEFVADKKKSKIIYKGKIICTHIKLRDKFWKIPESMEGEFFVDGVAIIPRGLNDYDFIAMKRSNHPNVHTDSAHRGICIGDLSGHPLHNIIPKLIDCLKVCGADAGFPNDANEDICARFEDGEFGEGEGVDIFYSKEWDDEEEDDDEDVRDEEY